MHGRWLYRRRINGDGGQSSKLLKPSQHSPCELLASHTESRLGSWAGSCSLCRVERGGSRRRRGLRTPRRSLPSRGCGRDNDDVDDDDDDVREPCPEGGRPRRKTVGELKGARGRAAHTAA